MLGLDPDRPAPLKIAALISDLSSEWSGRERAGLKDISLTLEHGEIAAVLGTAGSGAEELMQLLAGTLRGWTGSALLVGALFRPDRPLSRRARRQIAVLGREAGLIGRLSVRRNVLAGRAGHLGAGAALWGRFALRDRLAAELAMEQTGLAELADRPARDLPGEARRIALARCLCQEPRLLVLEQGWAGDADLLGQERLLRLVTSIARTRHLALVFRGEAAALAARYADRLLGMRNGCLVYDGPVDGLGGRELDRFFPEMRGAAHLRLVI
ncbi:MAG: ATP-binding cassette domain-containing protein [Alphaproteobacteria bacterium]|nr:MAG: ATP-binding cassette domain-containing protein [Alphaproteobacteria bacterium]